MANVYTSSVDFDPYSQQKKNIKQTGWDRLLNDLGFRSSYDKQMQDLDMQSLLRKDQLGMLEDEASYNSEIAKKMRLKAAGINPDLVGLSDASEAGSYTEPESTPSSFDYEDSGKQFFDASLGAVQLGMTLFDTFTKVSGGIIDLSQKGISNIKSIDEFAKHVVDSSLTEPIVEVRDNAKASWYPYINGTESYDSLLKTHGKDNVRYAVPQFMIPDFKFGSKRDQRLFDESIKRWKHFIGTKGDVYKRYYDFLKSKESAAKESSSPYVHPSFRQMESVFKPINDLLFKIQDYNLKFEKEAAKNNWTYEVFYDAATAATADNAGNEASLSLKSYESEVNAAWNYASESIKDLSNNNPVLGMIGMVLLNYLRSNMPMPQILQSRRQVNNVTRNSYDYSTRNVENQNIVTGN